MSQSKALKSCFCYEHEDITSKTPERTSKWQSRQQFPNRTSTSSEAGHHLIFYQPKPSLQVQMESCQTPLEQQMSCSMAPTLEIQLSVKTSQNGCRDCTAYAHPKHKSRSFAAGANYLGAYLHHKRRIGESIGSFVWFYGSSVRTSYMDGRADVLSSMHDFRRRGLPGPSNRSPRR